MRTRTLLAALAAGVVTAGISLVAVPAPAAAGGPPACPRWPS